MAVRICYKFNTSVEMLTMPTNVSIRDHSTIVISTVIVCKIKHVT